MKFLQLRLSGLRVIVKQPEAGYKTTETSNPSRYCAIMKGAVLYKLGLDFVKDRVMRVSYGTPTRAPFREGYHPSSRRVFGLDGIAKCSGVLHWFVTKVVNFRERLIQGGNHEKWHPKRV